MCDREMREKAVVEKCWRRVLYRSGKEVLEKSGGNTGVKRSLESKKVLLFNFSCIQLLLDSPAR